MTILALLLGFAAFAAAGDLVGRALRTSLSSTLVGRVGLALVLGPGVIAFVAFCVNLAGAPLDSKLSYSLAFGAILSWLAFARRPDPHAIAPEPSHDDPSGAERTLRAAFWIVLLGSVVLGAAFAAATLPYKDSTVNWSYKTLILWRDGTVFTDDFVAKDRHLYHPNYPLLVPLAQVFLYGLAGEPIDRAARMFQSLPHLGLALLVLASLLHRTHRTLALAFATLVAAIPHFYKADVQYRFAGSIPSGYADPLFAIFATTAVLAVIRWIDVRRPGDLFLAAVAIGFTIFTKNEGFPFAAALGLAFAIAATISRDRRQLWPNPSTLAAAAAITATIVIPWFLYRHGIPERDENYQHLLTLENLEEGSWRWPLVLVFTVQSALAFDNYGLVWVLLLCALIRGARQLLEPGVLCTTIVLVVMACVYAAVFIVTPLPIVDSLVTSIPRTFFHLSPIAVILAARLLVSIPSSK